MAMAIEAEVTAARLTAEYSAGVGRSGTHLGRSASGAVPNRENHHTTEFRLADSQAI